VDHLCATAENRSVNGSAELLGAREDGRHGFMVKSRAKAG
jgi:hypothetical protein